MSDLQNLIDHWQAGDERAAEAIYNQYRQATFGLAYALLDHAADAEEVTQDALTYALTNIDRYDPQRANFSTWLHTITVSRCRNKRRRRALLTLPLIAWLKSGGDLADPTPTPEGQALWESTQDEVWAAIQRLSQPLREAILLRHWTDHTYQEIADILGCPMRTVQSRVRLAYKQLRTTLKSTEFMIIQEEER